MKTPTRMTQCAIVVACLTLSAPAFVGCTATATRASAGETVDDSVVTAKVKTALARDDRVNGFAVNVETFRGVVQLSGFVDSAEEKRLAGQAAEKVDGVVDVENNISIKPRPAAPRT